MSEFDPTKTYPLVQHIIDPDLLLLAGDIEDRAEFYAEFVDYTDDVRHAKRAYQERKNIMLTPHGTEVTNYQIRRTAELIGEYAFNFLDLQNLESIPLQQGNESLLRKSISFYLEAKSDPEYTFDRHGYIRDITDALTKASRIEASDSESRLPLITPEHIRNQAELIKLFKEGMENQNSNASDKLAEIINALPSMATINYQTLMAFVDIERVMVDTSAPRFDPYIAYMFDKELAESMKGKTNIEHVAMIMDQAIVNARDDSMDDDMARRRIIAPYTGLKIRQVNKFVAGRGADINTLHPSVQLLHNAVESLQQLQHIRELLPLLEIHLVDDTYSSNLETDMKTWFREMPDRISDEIEKFYARLGQIVTKNEANQDTIHEALILEKNVLDIHRTLIHEQRSRRLISQDVLSACEELLHPRLKNYLDSEAAKEAYEQLAPFIEDTKQQLDIIEEPYKYASKKIRGYEGGTNLLRDLNAELDRLGSLHGDEIREELAIMLLQANNASDKEAYYDKLGEDRYEIEKRLADLKFLGIEEQTKLTDILHWIDEVIDGGMESKIRHKALKDFITDYYLGPETGVSDLAEEPRPKELEEAPQPEPEQSEPTEKKRHATESNEHAVQEYFAELQQVLETIEIEYADVAVFPPGKSERKRQTANEKRMSHFIDIDPNRLKGLMRLKNTMAQQGKNAKLIATSPSSWSPLPHFALYIQENEEDKTGVCILENPVNKNASYIFTVDGELIQNWEEIAAGTKQAARELGAKDEDHPRKKAPNFFQHYDVKLLNEAMVRLAALRSTRKSSFVR